MRPSEVLEQYRHDIKQITELNHVRNPRVFGSVLHGTDNESSDLDLLVEPLPTTTLMDIARIQATLERLTGVRVDVLTPNALPKSFRDQVLTEALPV